MVVGSVSQGGASARKPQGCLLPDATRTLAAAGGNTSSGMRVTSLGSGGGVPKGDAL